MGAGLASHLHGNPTKLTTQLGRALGLGGSQSNPASLWPAQETEGLGRGSLGPQRPCFFRCLGVAVGVGTLAVGSCCRVSLLPESPQDRHKPLTIPTKTPSTTGVFPTPTNHKPASSSPYPFCTEVLLPRCRISLFVPLPQGPGSASPSSPLPTLLWGQRLFSLLSPERPTWCPK